MDSLDQFLLNMKIELDTAKEEYDNKNFLQPYRYINWTEFLIPVGLEVPTSLTYPSLKHIFIPETEDLHFYKSAVIHGHTSEGSCAAPKMCHLYGFWPTKEYHPKFIKVFTARWKPIYLKLNWEVPT